MSRITVTGLHPILAAEIVGADLKQPPDAKLVRLVEDTMAQYAVAVVRDARITDEEHIRFSRAFGPLELPPARFPGGAKRRLRSELFDASNLDADGRIIPYHSERRALAKGAERFHSDSSFNSLPTKWSLLRGHVVPPEGGDTHFIDARAVYDALPRATRERIEGLTAIHDFWRGRERTGIWDNRCALHRATPFESDQYVRDMRRTTINEYGAETSANAAA
jgi:alpha-ketoglutarate-dependent 2,4-dichlorophenoxyacetate dioxygenase